MFTGTEHVTEGGDFLMNVDESKPYPRQFHFGDYARTKCEAEKIVLKADKTVLGNSMKLVVILFFNFWRTQVLFAGPLITLFWTSGDVCSGFQSVDMLLLSRLSDPQIHLLCNTCWLEVSIARNWPFSIHVVADHVCTSIGGVRTHDRACHSPVL